MEYLENYEIRKSSKVLLGVLLFFSIGLNMFFISNNNDIKKSYIESQEGIIGSVLMKYPELETTIVGSVLGNASKESEKLGEEILKRYAYDENLSATLFYETIGNYTNLLGLNIFSIIIGGIIIFLNYKSHIRIYKKLTKIETWTRALIDKKTGFRISEIDDGEISKLFMSFNKVNSIISESLDDVKKEKEFLINLLSDISHQLKTPLSSLMLNNEILLNRELERKKQIKFLISNENQLIRMKGLIENLLKLAKIDAGDIKFKKENTSIKKTVIRAVESLSEIASKTNVRINIKDKLENENIEHDSFWVQEAVMNVVKNCIEHSSENSVVKITMKEENLFIRVVIEDTGEGIVKEELPFIFDRFFKSSKSKKKDSAGIGLNLAKTIIEGQCGEISVESEIGRGTNFEIYFLK